MNKYGQYCPVARSAEILGDRWMLLIVRDLLAGAQHFNELERVPGVIRSFPKWFALSSTAEVVRAAANLSSLPWRTPALFQKNAHGFTHFP